MNYYPGHAAVTEPRTHGTLGGGERGGDAARADCVTRGRRADRLLALHGRAGRYYRV